MRMFRKKSFHRHDHARRAIAALKSLMLEKRLLHRVEFSADRQPLDGGDCFALRIGSEHQTRAHGPAVDQHGARTADTDAAAFYRTSEREIVAQPFQQSLVRFD